MNQTRPCRVQMIVGISLIGLCGVGLAQTSDFEVAHQVILEAEKSERIILQDLVRTSDGGYAIAGQIGFLRGEIAWATKTNAQGVMQWRYELKPEPVGEQYTPPNVFKGIAPSATGGVLLCGESQATQPKTATPGLLIQLDQNGKLERQLKVMPNLPEYIRSGSVSLERCIAWKDGFAVLGVTRLSDLTNSQRQGMPPQFFWAFFLSSEGKVVWEKLFPFTRFDGLSDLVILANQDLVFSASDQSINNRTEIIRINAQDQTIIRKTISGSLTLIKTVIPETKIHLIGHVNSDDKNTTTYITLDQDLNEIGTPQPVDGVTGFLLQPYLLPDRSVVSFDSTRKGVFTTLAVKITSDHKYDTRYVFKEPGSIEIRGVSGGNPNEFVVARQLSHHGNEDIDGLALTFLRLK